MDETQCLRMIRASLAPSTGCTEPAAIALNAATARKAAQGTVTQVTARLDAYLFKNAMGVGIPGADERGVDLCVALGITAGDADAGMNALHTVTAEQLAAAKALRSCVKVEIVDGVSGLYIETILRTPGGHPGGPPRLSGGGSRCHQDEYLRPAPHGGGSGPGVGGTGRRRLEAGRRGSGRDGRRRVCRPWPRPGHRGPVGGPGVHGGGAAVCRPGGKELSVRDPEQRHRCSGRRACFA